MLTNKTFIIAEAGVNHNGKIKLAYQLIDAAKKAGADAVKFQIFKTENYIVKEAKLAKYQKRNINEVNNQFDLIKKYELSEKDIHKIINYYKKKNFKFIFTI